MSGRSWPSRLARVLLAVAVLGLIGGILGAAVARAGDGSDHVRIDFGDGFTRGPAGTRIDMNRLAPGVSTSAWMGVGNGVDLPSDLSIRFTAVSGIDGGCTRSGRVVDPPCRPGEGGLRRALVLAVATADEEAGPYRPVWSGSVAQLEKGVVLARSIPPSGSRWLRLDMSLPAAAGDDLQSDRIRFGMQVVLESAAGVYSAEVGRPSAVDGLRALALTGGPFLLMAAGAAGLLGCGVLFVAAGGRTRRRGAGGHAVGFRPEEARPAAT